MLCFIWVFLIFAFIIGWVEIYLSSKWVASYFNFGIPVYRKCLAGKASVLSQIDAAGLNSFSETFSVFLASPLEFKKIREGQLAFRQRSFRNSFMRGRLFVEQGDTNLYMVGYFNWSFFLLGTVFIGLAVVNMKFIVLPFILAGCLFYYFIEKKMYDRVFDFLYEVGK